MNRLGFAACSFEFPGHGSDVDPEQDALIRAYLGSKGLEAFYEHLLRRNLKLRGLSFAIGAEDGIFLIGEIPVDRIGDAELDRLFLRGR